MRSSSELNLSPISFEQFPKTFATIDSGLMEGVAPGFVAAFWSLREPDTFWAFARGQRRTNPSGRAPGLPMEVETIFDVASVSKVVGTATLFALLVQRGWIHWDTRVCSVFPNYPYKDITCTHLLSHTSGLPAWEPLYERMKDCFGAEKLPSISVSERQRKMRELVFAVKPEAAPGVRAVYSDISFLTLGFLIEEVTSMPLDQAVKKLLWQPMGLDHTYYRHVTRPVSQGSDIRVAATEDCPWRKGVIQGQVHDDNCWTMGGYAGHAGVFSTARDLMAFSRMLLSENFLSYEILKKAWKRVSLPEGCDRTPGWDTPSGTSPSVGQYFSPHSVGHLGFTGTSLWLDLDAGFAVTLLSNRVHPTRENPRIKPFRARFHDALRLELAALGKVRIG